jgi:hypothetical protein
VEVGMVKTARCDAAGLKVIEAIHRLALLGIDVKLPLNAALQPLLVQHQANAPKGVSFGAEICCDLVCRYVFGLAEHPGLPDDPKNVRGEVALHLVAENLVAGIGDIDAPGGANDLAFPAHRFSLMDRDAPPVLCRRRQRLRLGKRLRRKKSCGQRRQELHSSLQSR